MEEGKRHTFLIINGKISSENVIIQNDVSFISIDAISEELNLQKEKTEKFLQMDSIQSQ